MVAKKRNMYRYAVDEFIEMINILQNRQVAYKCNDNDVQSWNKFVDYYDSKNIEINKSFIHEFLKYGLHSWFNPSCTESHKRNCRFSWVFGGEAIKRYNALDVKVRANIVRKGVQVELREHIKVKTTTKASLVYLSVRKSEEDMKRQFHNTKKALTWCVANTTLFFHKSSLCASCKDKVDCKQILKQNYYKVYKLRGYDK
jgi:hypothetical protein